MSKGLIVGLGIFAAIMATTEAGFSQETPIAFYTMNQTTADETGTYPDLNILNAPYQESGLYLNGIYYDGPSSGGSFVETPYINGIDFNSFSVSVEFKIGAVPVNWKPILIAGADWRWMGAMINSSGELYLLHNDTHGPASSTIVSPDTWYTLTMVHDGTTGYLYLDAELATSLDFIPNHHNNTSITTSHGGSAVAYEGHIRNLKVFNGVVPLVSTSLGAMKALYR